MKHLSDQVISNLIQSNMPKKFLLKIMSDCDYILNKNIDGLKIIILFGSCARLEMNIESDVDLLIVTDECIDPYLKSDLTSELDEPIMGVSTDVKCYTLTQLKQSKSLFVDNIRKDGILLWKEKD